MGDQLGLKIEPSSESFTFVDLSERSSGGIIRDLELQIGNALVPIDFHVLDIKLNWNSSLLLGRAFLATVGAVCDMNTNILCLTLINPDIHYDLVRVER
uniref:Aspartic peptidase DDI1-type domain-containing protein n=1 Tax=Brassica oleracea var. oleracea TaxID=109376 RepID=A0A0D3CRG1_BRAOL